MPVEATVKAYSRCKLIRAAILTFCIAILCRSPFFSAQAQSAQLSAFPVEVLVKSPADTQAELQVICLFHSDPSNTLHGSLVEINQKLEGLLDHIRTPSLRGRIPFEGEFGETFLIAPKAQSISARRLLIVGLGDSQTFTAARMNLVGEIVFEEASRLGVKHPFFAPTILDGGVTRFGTGEIAEQFMLGFMRARDTEIDLKARGVSPEASVERISFLAGAAHATDTRTGINKALNAEKGKR